ncbi:ABC transporter ATP-binding protein [Streptomyces sp. NPDC050560]|uniref:ABC transporter ATP-binding protein n=1 Tax=Streptomyces sp. NPDC050560 TaxID=3365630 RepID=UPI0037A0D815
MTGDPTTAPGARTGAAQADAAGRPVLSVEELRVRYGRGRRRRTVLAGVSLDVAPGETVGLVGETGSGKSTLARTVLGLVKPCGGAVRIAGEDVTGYGARQWRALRRRGTVQYVFQDPLRSLDPDHTLADSLAEPLLVRGVAREAARERATALLDRVGLPARLLDRPPGAVSGGQRQRVAVARALIADPALVILDEPVSALDSANRVHILELLRELRAAGTALVFISHDLGSVAGTADRVAVLYRGALVEDAAARDIVNRPRHPYTRLLVSSAPTLRSGPADRAEREALRALLHT